MFRQTIARKFLVAFVLLVVTLLLAAPAAAQSVTRHTVQRGETLQIIAARYGTTWQAIAAQNNLVNPNRIFPGQVLVITTAAPLPGFSFQYTIQRGDTLSTIAQRFNVSLDSLIAINNVTRSTILRPGQVLNIPSSIPPQPLPQPIPQPLPVCNTFYTVRQGDTLFRIAATYRVNIYRVAEANGLLNLNRIFTGQRLFIPCG